MQIANRVALVTGAARRVGRQIALTLAQKGCHIVVHFNRSGAEARALARELEGKYRVRAAAFRAELSDVAQVKALAAGALRHFGRLDVLVNSASVYERTPFGRTSEADWDRHLDANLKGPFFLAQEVGRIMRRRGAGKIVNIADWAGIRPYAGFIPYCVSKAGLITLTHALAKALAPEVQVNAVLPGPVLLPPDVTAKETKAIIQATLVKRLGSPKDVAAAVAYLIESDFVTGAALPVDGGRLIN